MARRRRDSYRKGRKQQGKARRFLVWILAAAVLLLLLGMLGYQQLLAYLQGEDFRHKLEEKACNKAQAECVVLEDNLLISGNRLSLAGVRAERRGLFSRLEASNISAEVDRGALFDRELRLTKLSIDEATLTLNADRLHEKLPPVRKREPGFWSGFTPNKTTLNEVSCKEFTTRLTLLGKSYDLADCRLTAAPAPRHGAKAWEFNIEGGHLHTPLDYLRDSGIKTATFTLGDKLIALSQARFMLSPGELILNAQYQRKEKQWNADLRVNKADVGRLLSADWKKRLSGELYGRLELGGKGKLQQANGTLALQQACLEALPILSEIKLDGTYPYRSLRLEKATCNLSYPYSDAARNIRRAWRFDKLDLRAQEGLLRVRGHVLIDEDRALAGTLVIGLPTHIVGKIAPLQSALVTQIFTATGEEGYMWLNLNLSGTLDNPQEDLSVRMKTLLADAIPEAARQAADTAGELFGMLFSDKKKKDAPAPAEDEGAEAKPAAPRESAPGSFIKNAGEAAGSLIGTGLDTLF